MLPALGDSCIQFRCVSSCYVGKAVAGGLTAYVGVACADVRSRPISTGTRSVVCGDVGVISDLCVSNVTVARFGRPMLTGHTACLQPVPQDIVGASFAKPYWLGHQSDAKLYGVGAQLQGRRCPEELLRGCMTCP